MRMMLAQLLRSGLPERTVRYLRCDAENELRLKAKIAGQRQKNTGEVVVMLHIASHMVAAASLRVCIKAVQLTDVCFAVCPCALQRF